VKRGWQDRREFALTAALVAGLPSCSGSRATTAAIEAGSGRAYAEPRHVEDYAGDTPAAKLSAALEDAQTVAHRVEVQCHGSLYETQGAFVVPAKTTLRMYGGLIRKLDGGRPMAALSIAGDDVALHEVNVEALGARWQAYGIWLDAARGARIRHCRFSGADAIGVVGFVGDLRDVEITDCIFSDMFVGALFKPGQGTAEDLAVNRNTFRRMRGGAISFDRGHHDNRHNIRRAEAIGNRILDKDPDHLHEPSFEIAVAAVEGARIIDNTIHRFWRGIHVEDGCRSVQVTGNDIAFGVGEPTEQQPIWYMDGVHLARVEDAIVLGNRIRGAKYYGILGSWESEETFPTRLTVAHNHIWDCGGAGIALSAVGDGMSTVAHNKVWGIRKVGVPRVHEGAGYALGGESSGLQFVNNEAFDCEGPGLKLERLPRLATRIADNRFRRCAEGDILLTGGRAQPLVVANPATETTTRTSGGEVPWTDALRLGRHADGLLDLTLRRTNDNYASVVGRILWHDGTSLTIGDDPLLVAAGDLGEIDLRVQGDMLQARAPSRGPSGAAVAVSASLEGTVAL
jgi:hypothetical protein